MLPRALQRKKNSEIKGIRYGQADRCVLCGRSRAPSGCQT